jgi:hypothetical protein
MAAEFNIDPTNNFKDFNRNIQAVINQLEKMLPDDHVLDFIPSVTFDEETFNDAPDKAKELGCSPDFNAWTGEVNPPPAMHDNPFLRTAAGHLHIGWCNDGDLTDPQHIMNCRDLVKQLDWYLGGWSVRRIPTRQGGSFMAGPVPAVTSNTVSSTGCCRTSGARHGTSGSPSGTGCNSLSIRWRRSSCRRMFPSLSSTTLAGRHQQQQSSTRRLSAISATP